MVDAYIWALNNGDIEYFYNQLTYQDDENSSGILIKLPIFYRHMFCSDYFSFTM